MHHSAPIPYQNSIICMRHFRELMMQWLMAAAFAEHCDRRMNNAMHLIVQTPSHVWVLLHANQQ